MKPALELSVSVRGPGGQRFRLSPDSRAAGDRPLDLSFTTEAGEGFNTGQVTLSRPYDREFPDLSLLNELTVEGSAGVAYEGRITGVPRSLGSGGPEVRLDCEGWMAHARQRPFTELLIDRDLGAWGEPSNGLKSYYLLTVGNESVSGPSTEADDVNGPSVRLTNLGGKKGRAIGVYRAPAGCLISQINFDFVAVAPAATVAEIGVGTTDTLAGLTTTGDLLTVDNASGSGSFSPVTPGRIGEMACYRYSAGAAAAKDETVAFRNLAVIGNHGLPVSGGTVMLSDAIQFLLGKYAPRLDVTDITPNSFPVPHAVWREPITAHDAIKELNAYSQWALGVYENRQVEYRPFDLSSYDWEVRAGLDGVEIETPGVTVEDAYNGVIVKWTDWAGDEQILTPDDTADLRDENPAIAANQWGDRAWINLDLSNPTSQDGAITQARLYLADLNRPKFPSTITVPGHIRDRTGAWQPTWKVRANQTISVRNHPNDAPRLITSTSWQGNQIQITTDNALNRWEAIAARLERARTAAGA